MSTNEAVNREWIMAELRGLRELAERERDHVIQRFEEVNKLRDQVLEERGVFVRHEALGGVLERLGRLEQRMIERAEHERGVARIAELERTTIPRVDLDGVARRIGKLEALGPVIVLVAGVIGSVLGALAFRWATTVTP